jgi:hypothetical protein
MLEMQDRFSERMGRRAGLPEMQEEILMAQWRAAAIVLTRCPAALRMMLASKGSIDAG